MKIYIVVKELFHEEFINIACFGTEEEAKEFCEKENVNFISCRYEEWEVGEVLEEYKDEGSDTKGN